MHHATSVKRVMTVCGEIPADALGLASMHDHVLADMHFFHSKPPEKTAAECPIALSGPLRMEDLCYLHRDYRSYIADNWDLTDRELMTREVGFFKERGGSAILEPSVPGIRHDPAGLRAISEKTGVHIIAGTGLYREETWPERFKSMEKNDLVRYMLDEIHHGIDGTDVRAGHIKAAVATGKEREFAFLEAAAAAANDTGLLVTVHTSAFTAPEQRKRLLKTILAAGLPPSRLLLCHMQYSFGFLGTGSLTGTMMPSHDLSWAREVLDSGANICVDLFGMFPDNETVRSMLQSDANKVIAIARLIGEGYGRQIVIGNDVFQKVQMRSYGGGGYARIIDMAVPSLRELGVSEENIRAVTVENPARMLAYS